MKQKILFTTLMSFTFATPFYGQSASNLNENADKLDTLFTETMSNIEEAIQRVRSDLSEIQNSENNHGISNEIFIPLIRADFLNDPYNMDIITKKHQMDLSNFEEDEDIENIDSFLKNGIKQSIEKYEDKFVENITEDDLEKIRMDLIKDININIFGDYATSDDWCLMFIPKKDNILTFIPICDIISEDDYKILINIAYWYDLKSKTLEKKHLRLVYIPTITEETVSNETISVDNDKISKSEKSAPESKESSSNEQTIVEEKEQISEIETSPENKDNESEPQQEISEKTDHTSKVIDEKESSLETEKKEETISSVSEKKEKADLASPEEEFKFTNMNLFKKIWEDFAKEKMELLHEVMKNNTESTFVIPGDYKHFKALDEFIAENMDDAIKHLKPENHNKITGIEKKHPNISDAKWNDRMLQAFKELYTSLDNKLFYVHWDKADATKFNIQNTSDKEFDMNVIYTLKRISDTKKFELLLTITYNKDTKKSSLKTAKIRCIVGKKELPIENKKPNRKK